MAQLKNSNAFRLGFSIDWIHTFTTKEKLLYKKYLQENLVIVKFIKNFFNQYTKNVIDSTNPIKRIDARINKTSSQANLIPNPFIEDTIIYSHVSLNRLSKLEACIYFFDSILDEWRLGYLKRITNASLTVFKPTQQARKPLALSDLKGKKQIYKRELTYRRKGKKTRFGYRIARNHARLNRNLAFDIYMPKRRSKNALIRSSDRVRHKLSSLRKRLYKSNKKPQYLAFGNKKNKKVNKNINININSKIQNKRYNKLNMLNKPKNLQMKFFNSKDEIKKTKKKVTRKLITTMTKKRANTLWINNKKALSKNIKKIKSTKAKNNKTMLLKTSKKHMKNPLSLKDILRQEKQNAKNKN